MKVLAVTRSRKTRRLAKGRAGAVYVNTDRRDSSENLNHLRDGKQYSGGCGLKGVDSQCVCEPKFLNELLCFSLFGSAKAVAALR